MAAPTTVTRVTPTGIYLDEGHGGVRIAFAADTNVNLWEETVTPPGIDNGDPIDTTTHFNATWERRSARVLKTLTDGSFVAAYDPAVYTELLSLVGVETTVTVTFPDGSTLDFYGYLRSFQPNGLKRGEFPLADCAVVPTNWDPANRVEAGFVLTSVAGT